VIACLNFTTVLCTQIHKRNQWKSLNLTHNTKQIKYRRKLHLSLLSLSFFGPMVSYLIIYYKNNTKHNEIQEKARRIQAGMCTEPKLTSNLHSRADTLSLPLLPACVFVIRDTIHHPGRFLLGKIVRVSNCSWTGVFVNRGSTVLLILPWDQWYYRTFDEI
jgi:hypothetical protein